MQDKKRGVDKEHQSAQQANRTSLQGLAHAIRELRDSIDTANRTAQNKGVQSQTKKAHLATFFQYGSPSSSIACCCSLSCRKPYTLIDNGRR